MVEKDEKEAGGVREAGLHYDADFEHVAAVTEQDVRWVMPRGSVP